MNIINSIITPSLLLNTAITEAQPCKKSAFEQLPPKFLLRALAQSGNSRIPCVNKNCKRLFAQIFTNKALQLIFLAELPISTLSKYKERCERLFFNSSSGDIIFNCSSMMEVSQLFSRAIQMKGYLKFKVALIEQQYYYELNDDNIDKIEFSRGLHRSEKLGPWPSMQFKKIRILDENDKKQKYGTLTIEIGNLPDFLPRDLLAGLYARDVVVLQMEGRNFFLELTNDFEEGTVKRSMFEAHEWQLDGPETIYAYYLPFKVEESSKDECKELAFTMTTTLETDASLKKLPIDVLKIVADHSHKIIRYSASMQTRHRGPQWAPPSDYYPKPFKQEKRKKEPDEIVLDIATALEKVDPMKGLPLELLQLTANYCRPLTVDHSSESPQN